VSTRREKSAAPAAPERENYRIVFNQALPEIEIRFQKPPTHPTIRHTKPSLNYPNQKTSRHKTVFLEGRKT